MKYRAPVPALTGATADQPAGVLIVDFSHPAAGLTALTDRSDVRHVTA